MTIIRKCLFLFVLFSLISTVSYGQNAALQQSEKVFDEGKYRHIDASIMSINIADKTMIIAERLVKIVTYMDEDGVTQHQTRLLDSTGKKLTLYDFKIRDRVVVEGVEMSDHTIISSSIIKTQ
ncbi:MAG: hypothetical protein QM498_16335 [Desulfobacterium sp.]